MLAVSNTYVLQSHTELTSYSTVRESHIQALVPRVSSYPRVPEHAQLTHNITPPACYPCTAPCPQHTAAVYMNFSGSRQRSAVRSHLAFENDTSFKSLTSTNPRSVSQSRNLPRSNYVLKSFSNPEHQNNLESIGNIASRNYPTECPIERKATCHSMARLKASARSPLHERHLDSYQHQKECVCNIHDEKVNSQMFAHQQTQEIHVENVAWRENHQQCINARHLSPACRNLNHSIASILNISSGRTDGKNCQETGSSINTNEDHIECNKTFDCEINVDTVVSEQNECLECDPSLTVENVDVDKNFHASPTLQNIKTRGDNEFKEKDNKESVPQSTNSVKCTSVNSRKQCHNIGDFCVTTDNTGKHNNHEEARMNDSFGNAKVKEAAVLRDTHALHEASKKINNVKNNNCLLSHVTKKPDFTSENLQAPTLPSTYTQLPFMSPTTTAPMLPPFHTLSQLHRKGAYDKASAFKPISKLAASLPLFPDHVAPFGNWACQSFVPYNIRTCNQPTTPATVYSSSVVYPKCITDFSSGNNTFGENRVEQHDGSFHQRHGYANMLNSSPATLASEKAPENVDRWMSWLRQTEEHPFKSGQFDERISSRVAPPPRYHCDFCNKTYSTFGGLSKHRQFHCSQHVKKEFSCKVCNRAYSSLGALKMHIRTHTLPCKCQECGKAFSRPWLLQGHLRTHTGEKPFKCSHCGRAFADRSNLRAHLQTHAEIKRYACCKCGKTFSRMSLLTKHAQGNCLANMKNR